jgi:succinate dehydrogenase flavin-adding protein (antitoxin of CptAB toxin-antitoxin module)
MLENDLMLSRWLERSDRRLGEADIAALDRLLDLDDNTLWDLLSGRAESHDVDEQRLVRQLRSV